jgi:hypothetical protein
MGTKFGLMAGLGIGYVLGAKAGRGRYEQIKQSAQDVWNDPHVQSAVHKAEDVIEDKTFLGDDPLTGKVTP